MQVLRGDAFNEMADVYSFGVVLWEMLSRQACVRACEPRVRVTCESRASHERVTCESLVSHTCLAALQTGAARTRAARAHARPLSVRAGLNAGADTQTFTTHARAHAHTRENTCT